MSDDAVTVRFEWTPSEHGRALEAEARHTVWWKAARWAFRIVFFGVAGGTALACVLGVSPAQAITTMLPWLVFTGFLWQLSTRSQMVLPHLISRRARGRMEERSLTAGGLDAVGCLDATFVPWSALQRVLETDEFFLFVGGAYRTHYLPKRLLSPTEQQTVRMLVQTHLPGDRVQIGGNARRGDELPRP